MKLAGARVLLQVSDRGTDVFRRAGVDPVEAVDIVVEEDDNRGLWIQIERPGAKSLLLVRWEHILSVELPGAPAKDRGLKP